MDADDEARFRDAVVRRSPAMLRAAYLITGDRGLAEDAVQAMWSRVYVAWPKIRATEALDAYCRRTLLREILSWRRRRRVGIVLTDRPAEGLSAAATDHVQDRDELRRALLGLPAKQRAVVVLR